MTVAEDRCECGRERKKLVESDQFLASSMKSRSLQASGCFAMRTSETGLPETAVLMDILPELMESGGSFRSMGNSYEQCHMREGKVITQR